MNIFQFLDDCQSNRYYTDGKRLTTSCLGLRYLDDLLNIDNPYFAQIVSHIHPTELQWNKANPSDTESKKNGKDQESVQLCTTPDQDTTWESDKNTIKRHKQEPRGQSFPRR